MDMTVGTRDGLEQAAVVEGGGGAGCARKRGRWDLPRAPLWGLKKGGLKADAKIWGYINRKNGVTSF